MLGRKKIVFLILTLLLIAVVIVSFELVGTILNLIKHPHPRPQHAIANESVAGKNMEKAKPDIPQPTQIEDSQADSLSPKAKLRLAEILSNHNPNFFISTIESPLNEDGTPGEGVLRKYPALEIPASVKIIAGLEEKKNNYVLRMKAADRLGRGLSEKEVKALLLFLHKKLADDTLSDLEFDAVKNDVASALMKQYQPVRDFAPNLIAMYYDKSFDNVWRNYCVQFLGQCYARIDSPEEREITLGLFNDALNGEDGIAGAALAAMSGLYRSGHLENSVVSDAAYKLCVDPKTPDIVKITAIQTCAEMENRKILPIAREIIQNSKNTHLRISAIAALGAFRDHSDCDVLQKLASASDIRLRTASRAALRKIEPDMAPKHVNTLN